MGLCGNTTSAGERTMLILGLPFCAGWANPHVRIQNNSVSTKIVLNLQLHVLSFIGFNVSTVSTPYYIMYRYMLYYIYIILHIYLYMLLLLLLLLVLYICVIIIIIIIVIIVIVIVIIITIIDI